MQRIIQTNFLSPFYVIYCREIYYFSFQKGKVFIKQILFLYFFIKHNAIKTLINQERLPPSDVVGNIRFSHPTLYVFPGGQGDSALFGINGFNMLIDGGFSRKACFWDFTRHLDRLDAILITRLNDENTQGLMIKCFFSL